MRSYRLATGYRHKCYRVEGKDLILQRTLVITHVYRTGGVATATIPLHTPTEVAVATSEISDG